MSDIAFTYDETKAPIVGYKDGIPERGVLDGVPMRDLTAAEFMALSEPLKGSVLACGFFVPTSAAANLLPPESEPEPEPEPKKKK